MGAVERLASITPIADQRVLAIPIEECPHAVYGTAPVRCTS